ncbi:MAG TPA: hypothetical protein VIZ90_06445 [Rhizobiaceae bacterium]
MRHIAVLLCGALAACSQTSTPPGEAKAMTRPAAKPAARHASADRCAEAVRKTQQQATNAAMLGGALSMVGGFGGFGGRGGAIASQAVSTGGSFMQAKARNDAQGMMQEECMS